MTEQTPAIMGDEEFRTLLGERAMSLLALASHLSRPESATETPTRPVLGELLSQATQIEELLDAYGAATNRRWCALRHITATVKLFSDVSYELLHIRHALPAYQLLPIEQDFAEATDRALFSTWAILRRAGTTLVAQAASLGIDVPVGRSPPGASWKRLPPGRLKRDRETRTIENAPEIVTQLATAFLTLAAESEPVHVAGRARPEEYEACFPDPISEETVRNLQHRFHNLQSLYDTYVSDTRTEHLDGDLPVLRGHVSVVFHLLKTGTGLAHYYERHVKAPAGGQAVLGEPPAALRSTSVTAADLLRLLMEYSMSFASRYLMSGTQLCQTMLDRYAEVGSVEVPAPGYRGFHVRPATLVAKIVRHYGSGVRMELEGESYDAGSPLDIFRANEKINARKRRWLASEIARLRLVPEQTREGFASIVRGVALTMAEQGKVVIYEHPLQTLSQPTSETGTLLEQVIDEVARLQATGRIDIRADMNVCFVGDKRVLKDIQSLAEAGYGEDNFGNNVPLPKELAYLRR